MTTIINQSLPTNYGVPATAWVVAGYTVYLVPTQVLMGPQNTLTLATSSIRVAGYANATAFTENNAALATKTYMVPEAQLSAVFDGGGQSILSYVLSLSDFSGATTS